MINSSKDLAKIVFNVKQDQGIKRFKLSNFKERSALFENQHIQVGYKSQVVFQNKDMFSRFISLNIFIGNKTQELIKDFQVDYKGDANQLLYANPREVESVIAPGYQNKQQLMIATIRLPFIFLTMNLSYRYQHSQVLTSIVLPNSVLKFASYM